MGNEELVLVAMTPVQLTVYKNWLALWDLTLIPIPGEDHDGILIYRITETGEAIGRTIGNSGPGQPV